VPDRTEEEQIEALKRWWSENGTSTILGVIVVLGAVLGYQAWQNHVRDRGEAASKIYQDMIDAIQVDSPLQALDKEHASTARFLARQLEEQYSSSAYAHFAALYLAKLAVDDKDLPTAERELKWALSHGVEDSIEIIVRMRLARVQLALDKPDEALRTLEGVDPGAYRPSYEEVKGDIYHAMGDNEQAREAYERAVNALGEDQSRPLLQMKLEDLEAPDAAKPVKGKPVAKPASDSGKPDEVNSKPADDKAK
jgi:predicted negative regulator of RcsB-dependent stress response